MDIRNKLAFEDVKSFLTRLWQQKKISIIAFGIAVVVILGAMLFTFAPSKDNQLHIMSTEEQKANREGAYSDSLSEPAPNARYSYTLQALFQPQDCMNSKKGLE